MELLQQCSNERVTQVVAYQSQGLQLTGKSLFIGEHRIVEWCDVNGQANSGDLLVDQDGR